MQSVTTYKGKKIEVISQHELKDPQFCGEFVRAFCHIHGSDHQRSLSIRRATGWGHCFNAACQTTVLVAEWNPKAANTLLHTAPYQHHSFPAHANDWQPDPKLPLAIQPVLLHIPPKTQIWQQDELKILQQLEERFQVALTLSKRAYAYLRERRIPLQIAIDTGVGYLPAEAIPHLQRQEQRTLLRRWAARFLFPLVSPTDRGYIGRSLWRWQPGMNEKEHKNLLEQPQNPSRWIKTNPAGWFCSPFEQFPSDIILVEGAFDRLALLAAGFAPNEIIALTGTTAQIEWFPPQIKNIILAFDRDEGGCKASEHLATQLDKEGFQVHLCPPPQDNWGKDWSERWQRIGQESVWPLQEQYHQVTKKSA